MIKKIKPAQPGRIIILSGLILFFSFLRAASAQEIHQLTQIEFNAELRAALEQDDDAHIEELIKNHRLYVKPFVDALVQESIRTELKGRLEECEKLNRMAARSAEIFNRIFSEKSLVIAVDYLYVWSKEQKKKKLVADSLYEAGTRLRGNQPEKAIEVYNQALDLYRSIGDERGEAEVLGGIGLSYWNIDAQKCLEFYLEALKMREKVDDRQLIGNTLNSLGSVYYSFFNDYPVAISWYNKAEAVRKELGDLFNLERTKMFKAHSYMESGNAFNVTGQYTESLENYEEAHKIYNDIDDLVGVGEALSQKGFVYSKLGDYDKALEKLTEASRKMIEANDSSSLAGVYNHFGIVLQGAGRFEKAKEYYINSLQIYDHQGKLDEQIPILSNLGTLFFDLKEYSEATDYLSRGLQLCDKLDDKDGQIDFMLNLANNQTMLGKLDEAKANYEAGLKIEISMNNPDLKWRLLAGLAENYERRGDFTRAVALNDSALVIIEQLRNNLQSNELKASYLAKERYVFEDIINLLVLLHEKDTSQGYDALTFSYAERSKSRVLLDLLKESSAGGNVEADKGLNKTNYPELVTLEDVKTICPDRHTTILEYAVGDSSSCLWIITQSDHKLFRLPEREILREQIETIRFALQDPQETVSEFYIRAATYLYENLLKPAEHYLLENSRLIIIPDGILYHLPFEVLLPDNKPIESTDTYSDLPYLIRKHPISYAQSASVLKSILSDRLKTDRPKPVNKKLVAFGDPVYEDVELKSDITYNRLKYSGSEVENIASFFRKGSSMVYLRNEANEENVKKVRGLTNFDYVHFATHGYINENEPDHSSLVLTCDTKSEEDGFLRASEIFNLKLNADLVVLSACQTGLGKLVRGEGLIGLTRAFLYAGTPSVLVSLWSVSDSSTALLMEDFYKYLIKKNFSKTDALRKAQLTLISDEKHSHPFYWAPFILVGDWR